VLSLHTLGHIFPTNLYIRWADESKGKFVGVLQPIPHDVDVYLIVDVQTLTVNHATTNVHRWFGTHRRAIASREVTILQMLDGLQDPDSDVVDDHLAQMQRKSGWRTHGRNLVTGKRLAVHAVSSVASAYDTKALMVRLSVAEAAEEDVDADSDSEEEVHESVIARCAEALHGNDLKDRI
jgi:hypothetical protein